MSSQDYRAQENRYRPEDFADVPRREHYEDARRYQSSRRDIQGQAGYGRGRDFDPRDDYGRDGEDFGQRGGWPYGRGRFEEEHFGGEGHLGERDYYERGREPRNYGSPDWEGYGSRLAGSYQAGGPRVGERDYGTSPNPRAYGLNRDCGLRRRWRPRCAATLVRGPRCGMGEGLWRISRRARALPQYRTEKLQALR